MSKVSLDTENINTKSNDEANKPKVNSAPKAPQVVLTQEMNLDGSVKNMTVREALRDAMAEEMRTDDRVFIMGEEVAEYQGAYKVTQGLLDEFGEKRVIDTPITEHGFTGLAVGAAWKFYINCRVHDIQFLYASYRPNYKFSCKNAVHVWRTNGVSYCF